jgi:hypothetical protein
LGRTSILGTWGTEAQQRAGAEVVEPFRAAGMQAELLRAKRLTGLDRPSPTSSIVANPFQVDWGILSDFTPYPFGFVTSILSPALLSRKITL